jgi:pyruvate,water dikinase
MDIEWGKDGLTGQIFILQARPETVQSRSGNTTERYRLTGTGDVLVEGRAIGQKIGAGASGCSPTSTRWTSSRPATCSSRT